MAVQEQQSEYDSPWKEALEHYFEEFMVFFFPQAHAGIDWAAGYEFLDKELQQVVRDAELGRRLVDKLVRVSRIDGKETWVLVHVEVQGQMEPEFSKRMYIYNYRLFDRYDRQVVSLAVLADPHPGWRPKGFHYELWGCRVSLEYPVVKLLDYEEKWSVLEQNPNPFAIIVMAHLKTQATQRDPEGRLQWKLTLAKMLYKRGYSRKDILELLRFVDWLMVLPENLKQGFTQALKQYEEETKMRYVTSFEEIGRQQGLLQKSREAVIEVLETRFEVVPGSIIEVINGIEDLSILKILHKKAVTTGSLEEFKQTVEKTMS